VSKQYALKGFAMRAINGVLSLAPRLGVRKVVACTQLS